MTVENGAPVEPGASGGANDPANPPQPKEDLVPYDKYRGLLDEKKKAQKRAEEAEAKLSQIEDDKLKASGDLQKIIDAEKEKNRLLNERVNDFETVQRNARKLSAFIKAAGSNLDDKWYKLVDLEKIGFKDGTDEIDQMTVVAQVDVFKKQWSEAFKVQGTMPPATAPNGAGGRISRAEFMKLPSKEMRKYKPQDVID